MQPKQQYAQTSRLFHEQYIHGNKHHGNKWVQTNKGREAIKLKRPVI